MTRAATFIIAAIAVCSKAVAQSPPVTFESPCECRDNHGEHRRVVKNDPSTPLVSSAMHLLDTATHKGPGVVHYGDGERIPEWSETILPRKVQEIVLQGRSE